MVDTPTADARAEPDISHVNPAAADTWFGHPRQLARLFSTEAWERFGYYGMRALLVLYLTKHFVFGDREASGMYGAYTALVYLTPLVGGYLADQYLGSKRAVKFGAVMMALGYFTLCFGGQTAKPYAVVEGHRYEVQVEGYRDRPTSAPDERRFLVPGDTSGPRLAIRGQEDGRVALVGPEGRVVRTVAGADFRSGGERNWATQLVLLLALSLVSVGNGFFKPNISTMVGELYAVGDRRRDSGFTIFYMGINLGSFFSQLLCPVLADSVGWWAGFGLAAIGMVLSWALIQFDGGRLSGYGEPPARRGPSRDLLIYACAVLAVPVVVFLYLNVLNTPAQPAGTGIGGYLLSLPLLNKLLYGVFALSVPGILTWAAAWGTREEFQMMLAAMVMIVFNVLFWTLFEQAGSSLTLFADRNTDRSVFGLFEVSAPQTQFFNAAFIVLLAPPISLMWTRLAAIGREPSIPAKFGMALVGVGAGFLFLVWGAGMVGPSYRVAIWWVAGLYLIHSVAELFISPVGLSMVTKLSIARVVGLMMGVWFLSISIGQALAGALAQQASVDTVAGQVTNLKLSLDTYVAIYQRFGLYTIGAGVVLLALSPLIRRWMHGVQ